MSQARLYCGDAIQVMQTLPEKSVQCCVTSPPYWGLRDYGTNGQLGLEATPEEYVAKMVEVFREVRRVLRDDGTLWLNLGDSYNSSSQNNHGKGGVMEHAHLAPDDGWAGHRPLVPGLKAKDLVGIPWRVAFALQADGWYLRSDIIWSKPNPMPESVTDRPTKAHEYVFLFSKSQRYYYDADALRAPHCEAVARAVSKHGDRGDVVAARRIGNIGAAPDRSDSKKTLRIDNNAFANPNGRNARTVWEITTQPYPEAHFATFPPELASRCIKAGSKPMDTVLDPFGGSGTTAATATGLGRQAIHIDLNAAYTDMAIQRIGPMFCVAL